MTKFDSIIIIILLAMLFTILLLWAVVGFVIDVKTQPDLSTKQPVPKPENLYGCPGCPSNFSEFAADMCSRVGFGSGLEVTDGIQTTKC